MIKISKGIYIHFLTVLLFAFCYINRKLEILAISYFSIFFHEIAHLVAALVIGLRPEKLIFLPFGVNLKLKSNIIHSLSDEVILYLSGPFLNVILAVISLLFIKNQFSELFYYNNIGLFLFNILPILPMDGGVLIKKILSAGVGYRKGNTILKTLSSVLILSLIILQLHLLYINKFNFSILIITVFLTGNIFTNKEKYNWEFTRELLYYKQKNKNKIKTVQGYRIKWDADYRELAKEFSRIKHYIIFKENKKGEITEILTEQQIIEKILNK